jgi:hypothetical protein
MSEVIDHVEERTNATAYNESDEEEDGALFHDANNTWSDDEINS